MGVAGMGVATGQSWHGRGANTEKDIKKTNNKKTL